MLLIELVKRAESGEALLRGSSSYTQELPAMMKKK